MSTVKNMERARDNERFDAEGLAAAKAALGGGTEVYEVTISIVEPGLLHHKFNDEQDIHGEKGQRESKEPPPEEMAYWDNEGRLCAPGWHLKSALVGVASQHKMPGRGGKKTYKEAMNASVFVEPYLIPMTTTETTYMTEIPQVDKRRVTYGRNTTTIRTRPLFPAGTELTFKLRCLFGKVPGIILRDCLIQAGQEKGIGDYRPNFGRFEVVRFERIDG